MKVQRVNYDPSFAAIARNYCLLGATDAVMGKFWGVSETVIRGWLEKYPEFAQACREGKTFADTRVVAALYQRAIGYEYETEKDITSPDGKSRQVKRLVHVSPDVGAIKFWLMNRQPELWRDKIELVGAEGGALKVESVTDTEIARRIAFALAKAVQGVTLEQPKEVTHHGHRSKSASSK